YESPEPNPNMHVKGKQDTWTSEPLQERWKGPFQILLTTFTAIKIAESDAWIHYTRVKKAPTPWKIISCDPKTLKLTLKHV
uniref:Murine leukemia virus integrase C-terminal domain-containing protein n=1 Tax=Strix occidentalis caurina TaxID=311401 RepID=A0A8D0KXQ8_STROC